MKTKIEVKCSWSYDINQWFARCYYRVNKETISGVCFSLDKNYAIENCVKDLKNKLKFLEIHHPEKRIIEIDI